MPRIIRRPSTQLRRVHELQQLLRLRRRRRPGRVNAGVHDDLRRLLLVGGVPGEGGADGREEGGFEGVGFGISLHPVGLNNVGGGDSGVEEAEVEDVFGVVLGDLELSSGYDEGGAVAVAGVEPPGVVFDGGGADVGEFLPLDGLEVAVVVGSLLRSPPYGLVVELAVEEDRRVY